MYYTAGLHNYCNLRQLRLLYEQKLFCIITVYFNARPWTHNENGLILKLFACCLLKDAVKTRNKKDLLCHLAHPRQGREKDYTLTQLCEGSQNYRWQDEIACVNSGGKTVFQQMMRKGDTNLLTEVPQLVV